MLLRRRASEIMDIINKTESDIRSSEDEIAGDIYIGAGEARCFEFIAKTIKSIRMDHPDIHVHLFSGVYADIIEQLENGVLDFGLVFHDFDSSRYESIDLPSIDRWGILMPSDSALAAKEYITPKDLEDKPLLLPRQILDSPNQSNLKWFAKSIDKLNVIGTISLIYNASILVEEGIAYIFAFENLINTKGNDKLCFRPFKGAEPMVGHVIYSKYKILSKASRFFLDSLRHEIA